MTLDWALHNDESTPHIHERHVFQCRNQYGEMCPQQEKALEELGIDLPDSKKPKGRNNNRKMTFDATCRRMFIDICKKYGIGVDEIPVYGGEKYLEKNDFIIKKQQQELMEQNQQLTRNGNLLTRGKRKIDEVTERAKSMEAELKVKDVEVQQKREELLNRKKVITNNHFDYFVIAFLLCPKSRKITKICKLCTKKQLKILLDNVVRRKKTSSVAKMIFLTKSVVYSEYHFGGLKIDKRERLKVINKERKNANHTFNLRFALFKFIKLILKIQVKKYEENSK